MTATNTAIFTFQPDSGKTIVTWTMTGKELQIVRAAHELAKKIVVATSSTKALAPNGNSVVETAGKTAVR